MLFQTPVVPADRNFGCSHFYEPKCSLVLTVVILKFYNVYFVLLLREAINKTHHPAAELIIELVFNIRVFARRILPVLLGVRRILFSKGIFLTLAPDVRASFFSVIVASRRL